MHRTHHTRISSPTGMLGLFIDGFEKGRDLFNIIGVSNIALDTIRARLTSRNFTEERKEIEN